MCLSIIDKDKIKTVTPNTVMFGYKVFSKDPETKKLYTSVFNYEVVVNKWMKAKRKRLFSGFQSYMSGFHIFTSRNGAIAWKKYDNYGENDIVIKRVKCRKITCFGFQINKKVIVAKEMLVIK